MHQLNLVFITADYDCDGTFYAAHRIPVPAHRYLELLHDHTAFVDHVAASGRPLSSYVSDTVRIMSVADFRREYILSEWETDYFNRNGYSSLLDHARRAPWCDDDTIGIPALDHTLEDHLNDEQSFYEYHNG